MRGLSPSRLALIALAALLPWTWFLLRDALGGLTDVVAILLPLAALGVALVLVVAGFWWRLAWVAAVSTLLMAVVAVLSPWLPADAGPVAAGQGFTVLAANVDNTSDALDDLVAQSADVLVVSEVPTELDTALAAAYPHHYTESSGGPEVGVYSRHAFGSITPASADLPGVRVELQAPAGTVVLYALHVPRPWYVGTSGSRYQATVAEHRRLIEHVAGRAAAERGPVVVAGDLNAVDRSSDYRVLRGPGQLVDAMREGWVGPTSVGKWRPLLLRIDYLLVSPGWCGDGGRSIELPHTSHLGVTATVGPCEQPGG